jgi:hypothetical protein
LHLQCFLDISVSYDVPSIAPVDTLSHLYIDDMPRPGGVGFGSGFRIRKPFPLSAPSPALMPGTGLVFALRPDLVGALPLLRGRYLFALTAQQLGSRLLGHLALHFGIGLKLLSDTFALTHLGEEKGYIAGRGHITSPDNFL